MVFWHHLLLNSDPKTAQKSGLSLLNYHQGWLKKCLWKQPHFEEEIWTTTAHSHIVAKERLCNLQGRKLPWSDPILTKWADHSHDPPSPRGGREGERGTPRGRIKTMIRPLCKEGGSWSWSVLFARRERRREGCPSLSPCLLYENVILTPQPLSSSSFPRP